MFRRIKASLTRNQGRAEDWEAFREAGYHDVPRYLGRHDRAEFDPCARMHTLGHLR